ncbi:MAG: hypothetical protein M1501_02815 [Candidatus Omnitrophica bacterium]|nr:hypothetical protein [Candidatus Omnitrophota bacterium]
MGKNTKAIGLLSGGLDSTVALKLMLMQDIDVLAVKFSSIFCLCDRENGCGAGSVVKNFDIPLKHVAKGNDYLEVIKNPEFGYGQGLNPCIDCRIYMFKKAKELMDEEQADFIFTGEVVNQRPFSQKKHIMDLIDKKSGLQGKILRPLSAKLLPPTEAEKNGIVDREKLLDIKGRRRKTQYDFVENFKIKGYACPSGGCLLTDKIFSKKMKEMFKINPGCTFSDINLLKHGRVFWQDRNLIVVGRNKEENEILKKLCRKNDVFIILQNTPSPAILIRGENIDREIIEKGKNLVLKYTTKKIDGPPVFTILYTDTEAQMKNNNVIPEESGVNSPG